METETINRLFLELSQFTTAKTALELALEAEVEELTADCSNASEREAEIAMLKAEVERLREAYERTSFAAIQAQLRKHGDHVEKCPAHPANWETALPAGACIPDCGWAAIEKGLA